jgi:hypothetical protein
MKPVSGNINPHIAVKKDLMWEWTKARSKPTNGI